MYPGLLCYRAGQEDSLQWTHAGLLAAADGSADLRANSQGTGLVLPRDLIIESSWNSLHQRGVQLHQTVTQALLSDSS